MTGLIASTLPTWEFSVWFANVLNIPADVSVKDQENGYIWFVAFLGVAVLNFLLACVLFCATKSGHFS